MINKIRIVSSEEILAWKRRVRFSREGQEFEGWLTWSEFEGLDFLPLGKTVSLSRRELDLLDEATYERGHA